MSRHPANAFALVLADGIPGQPRLIGYANPAEEAPDIEALRGYLKKSLADYTIPAAFVFLDQWPLSANGKLDRGRLPKPDPAAAADVHVTPTHSRGPHSV
ncbi:MAG: AMP-binding enzyme [Methylococcales bacterium]